MPALRSERRRPAPIAGALVLSVAAVAFTACAHDGRELRPPTAPLPARTTLPTTLPPDLVFDAGPLPDVAAASPTSLQASTADPTTHPPRPTPVIDRLSSPANATAEMSGVGALVTDPVTVDGSPADVIAFDVAGDGGFVLRVWIEDEGAHTVCVVDACGRVFTLAPDADTQEQVIAKIEAALPLVRDYLDYTVVYPDWTIEIGGALSGTGGSTDVATKTVTIYRNRGRTIDEFVRTVLHELGHVTDFERLDDAERAVYIELRDADTSRPWRDDDAHRIDEWGAQASEDFAEVMVMIWSGGRWSPRTTGFAPVPDARQLAAVEALVES